MQFHWITYVYIYMYHHFQTHPPSLFFWLDQFLQTREKNMERSQHMLGESPQASFALPNAQSQPLEKPRSGYPRPQ